MLNSHLIKIPSSFEHYYNKGQTYYAYYYEYDNKKYYDKIERVIYIITEDVLKLLEKYINIHLEDRKNLKLYFDVNISFWHFIKEKNGFEDYETCNFKSVDFKFGSFSACEQSKNMMLVLPQKITETYINISKIECEELVDVMDIDIDPYMEDYVNEWRNGDWNRYIYKVKGIWKLKKDFLEIILTKMLLERFGF